MKPARTYTTRSSAVRAARAHCKRLFGPAYYATEGPDYILPTHSHLYDTRYSYELRGPAKEVDEGRAIHKDGYLIPKEGA